MHIIAKNGIERECIFYLFSDEYISKSRRLKQRIEKSKQFLQNLIKIIDF